MTTNKLVTAFLLGATLMISTACGKKNTVSSQKHVAPTAPANSGGTPTAPQPASPQPSKGSQQTYALLQGTWTQQTCDDKNVQWSVKFNGDVVTYSGIDCLSGNPASGGWTLSYGIEDSMPASLSDLNSTIDYLESDGTLYYVESISGGTSEGAKWLYFSGDNAAYYYVGNYTATP